LSRQKLDDLDPALQGAAQYLYDLLVWHGLRPFITSGRRTRAQQEILYSRYLRGLSRFPAAPPGQSLHERGQAFDLVVTPREYLHVIGQLWISWGGRWSPSDPIHFSL
jgi:LAS superfamily LD-carboxypeptidase LdcB